LKLNEWNYKRTGHESDNRQFSTPIPTTRSTTSPQVSNSDIVDSVTPSLDTTPAGPGTFQDRHQAEQTTQHNVTGFRLQEACPHPLSANHFERILQRIHDAPSNCIYKNLLSKEEFFHNGSMFLHYVAAKGRVSDVLMDAIRFTIRNGYSIDEMDEEGYTALHVAVRNDRCDNAQTLLSHRASTWTRNKMGELPLHTYILTSESGLLIQQFLHHHGAVVASVQPPSAQAGQVALDLVVERVMRELSQPDTTLCRPATKHILEEVLKRLPTVNDNSRCLLRKHACDNPDLFSRVEYVVRRLTRSHELWKTMAQIMEDRGIHGRQHVHNVNG